MKAKNHNITWLQTTSQTEIMPQYQSLDRRERGKLRLAPGWWWIDSVISLAIVVLLVKEGREAWEGEEGEAE
jgi:hypothetical protein